MSRAPQPLSTDKAKEKRRQVVKEVEKQIPEVVKLRPEAPADGYLCLPDNYPPLRPQLARVKVIDGDAYEAAIELTKEAIKAGDNKPVCVLNNANAGIPGGGYRHGSLAQEEDLCYRSTLIATLKKELYPVKDHQAIYSPTVVIFRTRGNKDYNCEYPLMDFSKPQDFPVVSVVSVAAIYHPQVDNKANPPTWAKQSDRDLMYEKMRITLRICVHNGHRSIVLGALGAGAYGNPNQAVAIAFREVLQEPEFRARFDNIVFAVMQDRRKCYDVFHKELDGVQV
ncbi:uncharacterized protein DSM5745_01484 [Aspergillus mulundensis]|uniref:Microbial-type PARG catalytic domain-containing protein n=1 Tax=Aspergillus mulundensis TaxID=1810919 RepID=A0A3D8T6F5_9EURO|nr:hypothetical protein DSM5745_01484 [Aspergillus mulundensis]RDW94162.1 hypothetical protein DSM5745_01484 [Aspergillus mulundensis]